MRRDRDRELSTWWVRVVLVCLGLAGMLVARTSSALPEYTFTLTPGTQSVTAGATGTFTITMNKAHINNQVFTVESSDPTRVSVPATVLVGAGKTVAIESLTALAAGGPVTIKATQPSEIGGRNETATVVVQSSSVAADGGWAPVDGGGGPGNEPGDEPGSQSGAGRPLPSPPPAASSSADPQADAEPYEYNSSSCASAPVARGSAAPLLLALFGLALLRRRALSSRRAPS